MANSMRKSALHVNNCRNFSAHNLAVVKADPAVAKADPAVVKVAQVRAGQMRVDPDKAAQVRAAALVDAAASGLPIP